MNAYSYQAPSTAQTNGAKNRAGELGAIPGRSERFLTEQNQWFFQTREGAVEGPFDSRNQAGKALGEFLEFLSLATPRMNI